MNDPVRMPTPSTGSEETGSDGADPSSSKPPQSRTDRAKPTFWSRVLRLARPSDRNNLRDNFADALLTDAENGMAFSPEERAMLHNILRLREVRVEDVMVPRADVEAVEQTVSLGALMAMFEESGRSRMPVYNDNLDDPRGMIHIRDLLSYITKQARAGRDGDAHVDKTSARPKAVPLDLGGVDLDTTIEDAGIIRKVLFVPPSMLASDLMERMQATRTQMALVIDEYGGTDGLVSLEDIVEMVVGDIEDEHDDEEQKIVQTSDGVFIIDAKAELKDVAKVIGPDFDVSAQIEDVDTLGGLLFSELGRVPARGEVVEALPGFEFHVLDADPRRVKRVRVVRERLAERRRNRHAEHQDMPPRPEPVEARVLPKTEAEPAPAERQREAYAREA